MAASPLRTTLPTHTPVNEPLLDIFIEFKGWRWTAPFACMRCGIEVSAEQWAFSRSCGGCDCGHSPTARLHAMDARLFAGPHELIDAKDRFFLTEDRFLDPAEREKYPVLTPPTPVHFPPLQHFGCDQTDAIYKLGKACQCTCLHTVHPVANHFPGCPEFKVAEPGVEGVASN
jgi:hypothetical protein